MEHSKVVTVGLNFSFVMVNLALAVLVASIVSPRVGHWEGIAMPVGQVNELHFEPVPGKRQLDVRGTLSKFRDCELISVDWMKGDNTRLRVQPLSPVQQFPPSRSQPFGPFRVSLTEEEAERELHILTHHRCHPLWVTTTLFHPPGDQHKHPH